MPIGDAGAVRAAWRGHWNALLEAGAAQALERSAALSAGGLEGMPEQCLEVLRDVGGWRTVWVGGRWRYRQ